MAFLLVDAFPPATAAAIGGCGWGRVCWYDGGWGLGTDGVQFSPPPVEIQHRLTWRTDDTIDVIEKRLKQVNETPSGGDSMSPFGFMLYQGATDIVLGPMSNDKLNDECDLYQASSSRECGSPNIIMLRACRPPPRALRRAHASLPRNPGLLRVVWSIP